MRKRAFSVFVLLVLLLTSISAFAEPVPYAFNGYELTLPADMYVMTKENHDVAAIGLGEVLTQDYMDSVFTTQPGMMLDAISMEPLFEIFIFQNPVDASASFSPLSENDLDAVKSIMADAVTQKGVTLTSDLQVALHPQTKFYTYTGTADVGGQVTYILAYVTSEDGFATTVQLQTYDAPANEELAAYLAQLVQKSTFASLPKP